MKKLIPIIVVLAVATTAVTAVVILAQDSDDGLPRVNADGVWTPEFLTVG